MRTSSTGRTTSQGTWRPWNGPSSPATCGERPLTGSAPTTGPSGGPPTKSLKYTEKQQFLKAIYEDFYKAYNPAAADRLGVVYTPNEVVDFIIRGTDHLLQKHFGKTLADDNVQILDPATGTGTFITNLINYLPLDCLEHKYRHEIHANEVAILPYYIANLNIEYTYRERTGDYREFPNLCFVDTLDNMDWQQRGATGGAVTRQGAFNLGGMSEENWIRVQEQNRKAHQRNNGEPALQRQPAERERQQQEPGVPGYRPAHQRDLHRRQHRPEDQAVRHVQAVHPLGQRPAGRRRDYWIHYQSLLFRDSAG